MRIITLIATLTLLAFATPALADSSDEGCFGYQFPDGGPLLFVRFCEDEQHDPAKDPNQDHPPGPHKVYKIVTIDKDENERVMREAVWAFIDSPYGDQLEVDGTIVPIDLGLDTPTLAVEITQSTDGLGGNDCDIELSQTNLIVLTWSTEHRGWLERANIDLGSERIWVRCRLSDDPDWQAAGLEDAVEEFTRVHADWLLIPSADGKGSPDLHVSSVTMSAEPELGAPDHLVHSADPEQQVFEFSDALGTYNLHKGECPDGTTRTESKKTIACEKANGDRHGPFVRLETGKNGKVRAEEATYRNGTRVGAYTKRFKSGSAKLSGIYNENGKGEGTWRAFHPNGRLRKIEFYVDGRNANKTIEYDENGKQTSD